MANPERRRRRIDRLTSPEYLQGLAERDTSEIRAMREDCREEEAQLSYTRRLLQGRLDIVRAEMSRRSGEGGDSDLIDRLPAILADQPSGRPRDARNVPVGAPPGERRRRDDITFDDAELAHLLDFNDHELDAYLRRLTAVEQTVSEQRRVLLRHIDDVQRELVRRLRSGDVAVDEIVSMSVADGPDSSGEHRPG